MKAASSSEWYDTSPRHLLPHIHQHPSTSSISSSSSLPRLHHHHQHHHHHPHQGLLRTDSSSSSFRHEPPSLAVASSGYSFSSSTGTSTKATGSGTGSNNSASPHHNPPQRSYPRPQRQVSKVLTPTITSTSSTSFSKSLSRTSRSLSNNSTEPTTNSTSEANTTTEVDSHSSKRISNRPPFSFSSDASELNGRLSSLQQRQQCLFLGNSSGASFTSGNRVPSTPNTSFPPVISETEAEDETEVASTEEEGEESEEGTAEDYYYEDEDDRVYESFKNSVRMLRNSNEGMHQMRNLLKPRPASPAMSLQSVITELEEDEEDRPPESVDDEATSYTEGEEDEEASSSSSRKSNVNALIQSSRYYRSTSVPKTPVKVRVKVEKAVPQTYFDDRVKVTVQVEDTETEASDVDEYSEVNEEEEENSVTESESASTNTVDTVRYLNRDTVRNNVIRTGGESYGESSEGESGQSGSDTLSEESGEEEEEGVTTKTSFNDKTDYLSIRTPLFPPISGVPTYSRQTLTGLSSLNSSLFTESHNTSNRAMTLYNTSHQTSGYNGVSRNSRQTEVSVDSTRTATDLTPTGSCRDTASICSDVTASTTDLSSRSHSARSSLIGRASAIHKMYSVGGKLRSLSARRPPALPRRSCPLAAPMPRLQLSTDSVSHSTTSSRKTGESSDTSGSKQYLPDSHLGSLLPPSMLSHSRSLSASSSRQRFSAQLRQLSLGNLQAMNPPFPKNAAHVLAEKIFKGESLPPLTPPTPSSSSSTLGKPRPLVRNLTYTVCSHPTDESEDSSNGLPTLPPAQSTEHITLRQLIMRESSSTSTGGKGGSQESLHEVLFPANVVKKEGAKEKAIDETKAQVSFANAVIEHSLSSSHTLESTQSEQTGSTQRSDSPTEESSTESYVYCRLTGRRLKKLTAEQEEELLNKEYLTFGELQQESIEDELDTSQERLRHFALDTIRKQMELERIRFRSMTEQDDEIFSTDYDFSADDESDSTENSTEADGDDGESEEEDENAEKPKSTEEATSHIPVAASEAITTELGTEGSGAFEGTGQQESPAQDGETPVNQDGTDGSGGGGADAKTDFDQDKPPAEEPEPEEEEPISLLPTRINSAESGYRAMPPSRAESTRENSLDPEELEKEKERIMQQWKEAGGADPAITTSVHSTSSQIIIGGEVITINYSRPNTASESKTKDFRIQNGIDLTQELPGEEKKIAAVWEEFNRDEREGGAMADYEFSTLLDEMIMDVNSYKPKLSTTGLGNSNNSPSQSLQVSTQATSTSWEQPKFDPSRKYTSLSELMSLLSHNLRLVSSETLEDHMASLISLISSVLRKVRKNKTEDDYVTQIACLSAIRVLCDRLQEMTNSQNLKYADLSWLFRVLCKYSSDSDSKIRPEASFCLARLVKVAGPTLVVRPIYFILVMESEGGSGKTTTGAKTKAAAIDTLTYAMLTFNKDDFHNLEEIAGWVCLAMLNEERRIRQSALECLAIISQHLGGRDKALPLFHQLFLKEELDHFSRSPSPESHKTSRTGKSSKRTGKGSEPIPLSVHGTVRLLTGPGFPIAQPIDAITARLDKDVLPVPSTKGLIEYAVNVPTGKELVLLMTHMLEKDDDEWDFSSSTDSLDSESAHSKRSSVTSLGFSDIDWTGEGPEKSKNKDDGDLITPDVAYILLGKGRVNKSDVVLLDTYKKEIIPEIINMLNEKNKQGKGRRNRRRWAKNQKSKKKRRRRGKGQRRNGEDGEGPLIPTLSFDAEDDTLPPHDDDDDDDDDYGQGPHEESVDVFDEPDSPVAVVVDPPPEDPSKSTDT